MQYEIKKVRRIVADGIDLDTARIVFPNGLKLDVTYDRNDCNLIVHRWYKLDPNSLAALRDDLTAFFKGRVAA